MHNNNNIPDWEHFEHGADIGIRGTGATLASAFEQAGMAMTAVICNLETITPSQTLQLTCQAPDNEMLFLDWINELVYQMAVQGLLFSHYQVNIDNGVLTATVQGEKADIKKHQPAVEIKGATFTELKVQQQEDGRWLAQCVVDV